MGHVCCLDDQRPYGKLAEGTKKFGWPLLCYKDTFKSVLRYREAIVDWSCIVNEISKFGEFWLHTGFQEKHINPQFLLSSHSDLSPDTSSSPVLQTICAEDNRVTNICRERQTTTLCSRSRWDDQEKVSSLLPAVWEPKISPPAPTETQQTQTEESKKGESGESGEPTQGDWGTTTVPKRFSWTQTWWRMKSLRWSYPVWQYETTFALRHGTLSCWK